MSEVKPGWKTTEFWLSAAAMLVGALLASDVIPVDSPWMKLVGMASTILAALGYGVNRTMAKGSALKHAAITAMAPKVDKPVDPQ